MHLIAGAYPAAPTRVPWSRKAEAEFLATLVASPVIGGLELPFLGDAVHGYDEAWLLDQLPSDWSHVITAIPATMALTQGLPTIGLASTDPEGRAAALALTGRLRDAVYRVNDHAGRQAVLAVEVHSAPRHPGSWPDAAAVALTRSLEEILQWDWAGAHLVLEHCDAESTTHTVCKGFAPLAAEIEVAGTLRASGGAIGIGINWGRSVIEGRDAAAGLADITAAADAGVLSSVIFSGAAPALDGSGEVARGPEWVDAHQPPATVDPTSLLRASDIADGVRAATAGRGVDLLGVKVAAGPRAQSPVDRAQVVIAALQLVADVADAG